MTSTYQQLTYEQRCQIYALNKRGDSQRAIAALVGTSQSTISRELRRNRGERGYRYKQAHEKAVERRRNAATPTKMTEELIAWIEELIREEWSPEQISGWLLHRQEILISHETIYQHIWADKGCGGDLYLHLRYQGKKYEKRWCGKSARGQIKNRIGIEERPMIVEHKKRIGDWEIDTMIGKRHSGALVTIVERKTNFTLASQIDSKSAEAVSLAATKLLEPFKSVVHTITADNGKEFAYHEQIAETLDARIYFVHPYSSWERGLNENTNGLLRQYFPKSTDLKQVTQDEVDKAVAKLNARPRKLLGFRTPQELMDLKISSRAA